MSPLHHCRLACLSMWSPSPQFPEMLGITVESTENAIRHIWDRDYYSLFLISKLNKMTKDDYCMETLRSCEPKTRPAEKAYFTKRHSLKTHYNRFSRSQSKLFHDSDQVNCLTRWLTDSLANSYKHLFLSEPLKT